MPTRFGAVQLGSEDDLSSATSGTFDGSGNVSLALP
jgi:hypothetical protein